MKYLLIDGNNLAIRSAFANEDLTNQDGVPTGCHYGVFQSILNFKEQFPDHQFLIVWDGKSARRIKEASQGVEAGLVKSGYKENREKSEEETPKPLKDFYAQAPYLKMGLDQTGIPQIRLPSFEADDVIASYSKSLDAEEIVLVTSDKDYYQLLNDKVSIWDGMKQETITEGTFKSKFGIDPVQYIDCGALMGDTGDNIFGIPGWGEVSSLKAIKEHKTWQAVIADLKEKYKDAREQYPDVTGDDFERLRNIRTPKEEEKFKAGQTWKGKYPDIKEDMPFTGVALAFEEKRWKPDAKLKKGFKANVTALMFEERVELAYSLKKMDSEIEDLPSIDQGTFDREKLLEYFNYYDIVSLVDSVDLLK